MQVIISAKNLTMRFGNVTAVDNINIEVYENEIYGFLGPNGAGKTTTIKMLTGALIPTTGFIYYNGEKFSSKHKHKISVSPQKCELSDYLTAYQNMYFYGSLYGLSGKKLKNRIYDLLRHLELENVAHKFVKTFSGGMKQRLNLLISLVHSPDIIFLDEPTTGLDPQARHKIWEVIRNLKVDGKTIFLTTHYMEEADELCDRVAIIDKGKIIALGTPEELKNSIKKYQVIEIDAKYDTQIINEIKGLQYVKDAYISNEKVMVVVDNVQNTLPEIIKLFVVLKSLEVKKPSLEDVFLELTGKHLRN